MCAQTCAQTCKRSSVRRMHKVSRPPLWCVQVHADMYIWSHRHVQLHRHEHRHVNAAHVRSLQREPPTAVLRLSDREYPPPACFMRACVRACSFSFSPSLAFSTSRSCAPQHSRSFLRSFCTLICIWHLRLPVGAGGAGSPGHQVEQRAHPARRNNTNVRRGRRERKRRGRRERNHIPRGVFLRLLPASYRWV
jgi:hypothetical protein